MKIVTTDDYRALHLVRFDDTLKNTAANGDIAGERTLVVDVRALDGVLWGLETKTDVAMIALAHLPIGVFCVRYLGLTMVILVG